MTLECFKLPAGRIVGGDPNKFEQAIDFYIKQPKTNKNGQPVKEHRIDLAIPKAEFMQNVWPYVVQEVAKIYPQYANVNPEQLEMTRFAWKIINGDSPACPQGSNVPYNTRDGYKGCYVIKIRTSAFCPSTYKFENGAYRKVEAGEVKTGDYVVTSVNLTVHTEKDGGIYWNPNAYEIVGYGQAIKGSVNADPMKLFGGQVSAVPVGASATPISSAPGTAQMPMPQAPVMPQAPMPAPAYDFVNNAQGVPTAQPASSQPFSTLVNDRIPY
nr:MAG TPA: protein of unknown function DUF2815 [Caudoviricetes sp.]